MSYDYGLSPVGELPVPLDGTPLDAISWGHQIDAAAVRTIRTVASLAEQDEYMTAVTAAGLGPSTVSPVTVRRMDLNGLVMVNDGTGWRREFGGRLNRSVSTIATGSAPGGTLRSIATLTVNLPCAAQVIIEGDTTVYPLTNNPWAFSVWFEDGNGVRLGGSRRYHSYGGSGGGDGNQSEAMNARIQRAADLPAGASALRMYCNIESASTGMRMGNTEVSCTW